jgi:hypothetical protein
MKRASAVLIAFCLSAFALSSRPVSAVSVPHCCVWAHVNGYLVCTVICN